VLGLLSAQLSSDAEERHQFLKRRERRGASSYREGGKTPSRRGGKGISGKHHNRRIPVQTLEKSTALADGEKSGEGTKFSLLGGARGKGDDLGGEG